MIGRTVRIPGPLHQVLADKLDRLVRDLQQTPDWARDHTAEGETVEIIVVRRPAVRSVPQSHPSHRGSAA